MKNRVISARRERPVRCGFTIIELLVCITIIGILTSLLLPAVHSAREMARRLQCKSNLKQLALAAQNFAALHGRLPAGMDSRHVGPIVYLLPHLDQTAYYDGFSHDDRFVYWWQNPANRPPVQGVPWETFDITRPPIRYGAEGSLSILLCPSAPTPEKVVTPFLTGTRGISGIDFTTGLLTDTNLYSAAPGSDMLGRNYYGPVAGDWYYSNGKYRGIFCYSADGKGISFAGIRDGTSNTLMFGETAGGNVSFSGAPGPIFTSLCVGTGGLYITDGFDGGTNFMDPDFGADHFGSRHVGVIQFAFADGSVRSIRNPGSMNAGPGFQIMLELGGASDGAATIYP